VKQDDGHAKFRFDSDIVVPLPPGENPFAVNNNNMYLKSPELGM
jgi:hypothetical protein